MVPPGLSSALRQAVARHSHPHAACRKLSEHLTDVHPASSSHAGVWHALDTQHNGLGWTWRRLGWTWGLCGKYESPQTRRIAEIPCSKGVRLLKHSEEMSPTCLLVPQQAETYISVISPTASISKRYKCLTIRSEMSPFINFHWEFTLVTPRAGRQFCKGLKVTKCCAIAEPHMSTVLLITHFTASPPMAVSDTEQYAAKNLSFHTFH